MEARATPFCANPDGCPNRAGAGDIYCPSCRSAIRKLCDMPPDRDMMTPDRFITSTRKAEMSNTPESIAAHAALVDKIETRLKDACTLRGLESETIVAYVLHGQDPGGFLGAVLEDSLMKAAQRADLFNGERLFKWAEVLYNYVPAEAKGSVGMVNRWIGHRGLEGLS